MMFKFDFFSTIIYVSRSSFYLNECLKDFILLSVFMMVLFGNFYGYMKNVK